MSVVICAYTTDRWAQIREAVRSVLEQDPAAYEVLLVVDHCESLLRLAQEAFAGSEVRVIANLHAKGLSGARNTGTAAATGDVVAFLDDDAVAQPGWLAGHARHYEDPVVLGVGGEVLPAWERAAPRWFPVEFGWVVGCSYRGQPTVTAPVRNPIGANMSFRRSVIEAVGGFATSLGRVGATPEGCEETEFSIRAAAAFPNSKILHEPRASVRHYVPAHRGTWTYFRRRCWAEGRSKARMSRLVSPRSALASESAYVRRTLPDGVRRNVVAAGRRRDLTLLARATAICLGFVITSAGFTSGRLTAGFVARHEAAGKRLLTVDQAPR